MKIPALFIALVVAATPVHAYSKINRNTYAGQSYDPVRLKLKRRGLTPVKIWHAADEGPSCYDNFCAKYPEALDCTGGGVFICKLVYRDAAGKYIIVQAGGEPYMKVESIHNAEAYDVDYIKKHNKRR